MDSKPKKSDEEDTFVESFSVGDVDDTAVVEEEPEPQPESAKVTPVKPEPNTYVLEDGDTPGTVSEKLYDRGHKAVAIVRANLDVPWVAGSRIKLP